MAAVAFVELISCKRKESSIEICYLNSFKGQLYYPQGL